jgi:N-acetylglucosamine malate deacetylase 1
MKSSMKDLARLALGHVFALALRAHSQVYRPEGPVIVVAPHPDDETLGCGGLVACLARSGASVHTMFLSDGEASHPAHPLLSPPELARRRKDEALAALAVLGINEPQNSAVFLGATDGQLDRLSTAERGRVVDAMTSQIQTLKPTVVLAPYRFGGSTEHTAANSLVRAALATAGGGHLLEYPVWAWWNPLRLRTQLRFSADNLRLPLDRALWESKRRALACHRTQILATPPWPEPVLPAAIIRACMGRQEFYFHHRVTAAVAMNLPAP